METQKIARKLKRDFFGIDDQIDQICEMISPWSDMPDSYIRPIIVNLWGQTGVGKTSLVRKLAEILNIPLIELDLGNFVGSGESDNFSKNFFEKYYDLSGKPCIILLDEFHIIRTISEEEEEIDREKLRGLWSLLSDGKIVINSKTDEDDNFEYIFDEAIEDYERDQYEYSKLEKSDDEEDQKEAKRIKNKKPHWYFSFGAYFFKYFCKVTGTDYLELKKGLEENFIKTVKRMKAQAHSLGLQPKLDYQKSLIFISGNLDNIYKNVKDFDPDVDLINIYESSKELTPSDVKAELSERFRAEQIGRLGNNHIIYYALNKESYLKIIKNDLKRISNFFKNKEDVKIQFDFEDNVTELVYREGVVPAQGARSVLSTIGSLIEPKVILHIIDYKKNFGDPSRLIKTKVTYDKENNILKFKNSKITSSYHPKLYYDELRKPKKTNATTLVAVHEAGHVLISCLSLGIVPNRATAFTVGNDKAGVVQFVYDKNEVWNKESLLAYIQTCLAGVVAERIVFGPGKESFGCSSDMEAATRNAFSLVCVLDHENSFISIRMSNEPSIKIERQLEHDKIIENIIRDCTNIVERTIRENKTILFSLAEALLSNSFLDKNAISKIMKEHGVTIPKPFSYMDKFDEFGTGK